MATKGHSTKLAYGDAANYADSETWTDFAKITEITPPNVEADDIDISHMDSPDQFKEFTAGWADGGEVECTIQFAKAANAAVYGLFRQDKGYKVTFVDGSTWELNGYMKAFGNEVEREGIVTANVTIKVSGKPVFTPAA
jgi:hypothetical protein